MAKPMNFDPVGGRTFALTVGCGIATSVMQWFGKLESASAWSTVIVASVCAYIAKSGWDEHTKVRADLQRDIAVTQATTELPVTVAQAPK